MEQRILILDDETIVADILSRMLHHLGRPADIAHTVEEAQALTCTCRFDIAFIDLSLGNISGIDALKLLQKDLPGLRAVITSGYPDEPVMRNPAEFGFASSLAKPFDLNALKNVIESL
jgi:DNA-binding NtrC family response regulator